MEISYDEDDSDSVALSDFLSTEPSPEPSISHRELLFAALEEKGYTVHDVPGTGDCLFAALAHQTYADHTLHMHMRKLIVDEIRNNRERYEADIIVSEMEGMDAVVKKSTSSSSSSRPHSRASSSSTPATIFDDYIRRVSREGQVGDAICIAAYAHLFGVDVRVNHMDEVNMVLGEFTIRCGEDDGDDGERGYRRIGWYRSESGLETANHFVSVVERDC